MNHELDNALKRLAEYLVKNMGENKAIHFINKFVQIPAGNTLKTLVDALVLYTCQEYGINKETFFHSTRMVHCYARITCYHILKAHVHLPVSQIAKLFLKKKKDSVIDGVEKAQGMLDVPQYNPDFVSKYKTVEKHYLNYTRSLSDERI